MSRGLAARIGVPAPRLIGFPALAVLAATEWARQVDGLGAGRVLLWVLLAMAAGAAIRACDLVAAPGRRWAVLLVAAGSLLLALPLAGLGTGLLRPSRWDELLHGLAGGAQGLVTVRLPYVGLDPWPGLTLQLVGAVLCVVAGLLTFWPRSGTRGYPFFALAALLVLAAAPVVSLGGSRSFLFSMSLAALTVCFLWLERVPLRPGLGVTALVAVALVGALPLAGAADREAPWFDVKEFAEGVGPQRPTRFGWEHTYGPIDWPRDRREVLRVKAREAGGPEYWKAATLDEFDGEAWVRRQSAEARAPAAFSARPQWTRSFEVSVRLLRSSEVIGPGLILDVSDAPRGLEPSSTAGRWESSTYLRRGDSYVVRSYSPRPSRQELASAGAGIRGREADDLVVQAPFRDDVPDRLLPRDVNGVRATAASVHFPAFAAKGAPRAQYLNPGVSEGDGALALRRSAYARTWRLAQRLRREARTPYEYVTAVDRYLHGPRFEYAERPAGMPYGVAPLDGFLFDTKAGHCQHFSGAMALLLRMGGVPARVASGFSPGGYSASRKQWVVRDSDAHSWVEAWFDAYGWVTFDPTPSDTPARSLIGARSTTASGDDASQAAVAEAGTAGDRLGREQAGLRGGDSADAGADARRNGSGDGTGTIAWVLALAGVLAAGALVAVRARRPPRPSAPLDRAIAELEIAVRRTGRPAAMGTTLRQIELGFERSEDAMAYVRALRRARYSAQAPRPTAHQRRAVRRELARSLGWLGRLRALWALPPRRDPM